MVARVYINKFLQRTELNKKFNVIQSGEIMMNIKNTSRSKTRALALL